MDFNDSPEEAAFRAEARAWLEKTLGAPTARSGARPDSAEWLQTAKAYQAKKAAAGYVGLTWRKDCLLYTSPSPLDRTRSRMPSSA